MLAVLRQTGTDQIPSAAWGTDQGKNFPSKTVSAPPSDSSTDDVQAGSGRLAGTGQSARTARLSESELVLLIDTRIRERWQEESIVPAKPANDAEFLRRVSLDLSGQVPSISLVRQFLGDPSPDKRRKIVQSLLESPRYIVHFSNVWRAELLPEVGTNPQLQFLMPSFQAWLKDQLIDNDSYAELARRIITLPIVSQLTPGMMAQGEVSPLAFYLAKEGKPENLAAGTARVFLGLRIECAQCHDHPMDNWKQEQFWRFAAFYSGVSPQQMGDAIGGLIDNPSRRELTIPEKKTVVEARFLDESAPDWTPTSKPRTNLADWLTSKSNPYFAKAAVNRVWGRLFGVGLVDPVDDFSESNVPSHPELLEELAFQFAAADYDLKFLFRVLTATEAYQLTSTVSDTSQLPPQRFARMTPKGLSPEQLFDSLVLATGYFERNPRTQQFFVDDTRPRAEIQEVFSNETDPPTERQTSILQALALMNGRLIAQITSSPTGLLGSTTTFPGLSRAERVATLFLATLGRFPTEEETTRLVKYCEGKELKTALSDILWALLNSTEFLTNH